MIGMLVWTFKRIIIDSSVLILFFLLVPGLPPYNSTFSSYSVTPPLPLSGALIPNDILDSAERILEGKISGPESIAWKTQDEIFLSIHGGTIVKIFGKSFDRIARVAKIGPPCKGPWQEKICGRPLGLRFAPDGKLLVADAYYGIFSVNVETGDKECLVSPEHEIDGKPFKIANDIDVDNDGKIYWSDSSYDADLTDGALVLLADPTGRLMKYDPTTGQNEVLLKGIHFANGVQLSPNQDFVLLAETGRYRIHRYWLKGDMAGRSDIFLDGLPGSPDNIRPTPNGGFYVSLCQPRLAEKNEPFLNALENIPILRKLLARVLSVAELIIDSVNKIFPHELLERTSYNVLNLSPIVSVFKSNVSIVVEVDVDGNILGSLQGSTGKIPHISETAHVGNNYFFGSPYNKFLGRLNVGPLQEFLAEGDTIFEAIGEGITMVKAEGITIGEGITMVKPKDAEEIEADETETPKDEQVMGDEIKDTEEIRQDLEKSSEPEINQGIGQVDQIADPKVQEEQISKLGDLVEEEKIEIEKQDIETVEADIPEEKPVNLMPEESIHTVDEKGDAESTSEIPVHQAEDIVHVEEEIRNAEEETTNLVEKIKIVEEETTNVVEEIKNVEETANVVEEIQNVEETANVDEGSVIVEDSLKDSSTKEVDAVNEGGLVDSEVINDDPADVVSPAVKQNMEEAQVENVIPDQKIQQIEEPTITEHSQQNLEENEEVKQNPQVPESKDEL